MRTRLSLVEPQGQMLGQLLAESRRALRPTTNVADIMQGTSRAPSQSI
jgi:hypothetical protein